MAHSVSIPSIYKRLLVVFGKSPHLAQIFVKHVSTNKLFHMLFFIDTNTVLNLFYGLRAQILFVLRHGL